MMEASVCERCKKPLLWDTNAKKLPHLHHNHETGEIYGFTHPRCNLRALEDEIEHLRKEIRQLGVSMNSIIS
jgi:hypothetical protein